jgi:hypothetical protein
MEYSDDIYDRIRAWWRDSSVDFHLRVRDTQNWQEGWALIRQWLNNKYGERDDWIKDMEPCRDAEWAKEVHIWSHDVYRSVTQTGGHSLIHAQLEEELTRLVLGWLCYQRLIKTDGSLDKNAAYILAKLLSDKPGDALALLRCLTSTPPR